MIGFANGRYTITVTLNRLWQTGDKMRELQRNRAHWKKVNDITST